MSAWNLPETYNSQGLVNQVDSFNSSEANLISQSEVDSSLDSSFEKNLPTLFVATAKGLHPSLVTDGFSSSLKSSKHLTRFLTSVFSHGLKIGDLETCIVLAKQFNCHKSYSKVIGNAVLNVNKAIVCESMIDNLGMLILKVLEMLDKICSGKDPLVHVIVDTLVKWVSPGQDKKREVTMSKNAKMIISKRGSDIGHTSMSGYKLVYSQVKAGLVGDCLSAETRAVLLDTLVIMGRHVIKGDATRFLIDDHQVHGAADSVDLIEENMEKVFDENANLLEKNEGNCVSDEYLPAGNKIDGSHKVEDLNEESEEISISLNRAEVNPSDLEMMKQEVMPVCKEKSMLYDAGFVCSFSADVENIKEALEKKQGGEVGTGNKNTKVELISPAMF